LLFGLVVLLIVTVSVVSACGGATPTPTEPAEPTEAPTEPPADEEPTEAPTEEEPTEAPTATMEEEPTEPPASADGETLLQERCTECHDLGRVESAQKTREEWEDNVIRMVDKGAQLNEDEQAVLIDYLADTYAP
jgi:cytochrome c5